MAWGSDFYTPCLIYKSSAKKTNISLDFEALEPQEEQKQKHCIKMEFITRKVCWGFHPLHRVLGQQARPVEMTSRKRAVPIPQCGASAMWIQQSEWTGRIARSPRTCQKETCWQWGTLHTPIIVVIVQSLRLNCFSDWLLCDPTDCSPLGSSVHGISRQEYWSILPFPFPGDLPGTRIEPTSPALAGGFFTIEPSGKSMHTY